MSSNWVRGISGAEPRSLLEIARGAVRGHASFRLSGVNPDATGWETAWPLGGDYSFPTAAETLRIRAGNAADGPAGSGARTVRLRGLDDNFQLVTETLATAGSSASSATSASFARLNEVIVTGAGSYGGTNVGNLIVEGSSSSGIFGGIEADAGASRVGVVTVPEGRTAYIVGGSLNASALADVDVWERRRADEGAAPFGPARRLLTRRGVLGVSALQLAAYVEVPEKTDLWVNCRAATASPAAVAVELEILIVDGEALNPE